MKKKLIALITAVATAISLISLPVMTRADSGARQMERLDRGTVAVKVSNGVYLSWRLLGSESLSNQAFDIYRDGKKIYTTGSHDATCYTDTSGTVNNSYAVVPAGTSVTGEKTVTPWNTNVAYTNGGFSNSVAYHDIFFSAPSGGTTPDDSEYTYSANDMSVGDLDGDGEYELIVKWDPSNSNDNSQTGYTGNVYIDAYKLDGTRLWRMDLGPNIRAGAHYTQYIVYDFDGDGRSEIAFKTAPGSKDGLGRYVSAAGKNITAGDDSKDYRGSSGLVLDGPEYLTIFYGETGEAMQTIDYDPPRSIQAQSNSGWGDNYGNRSERYLAGVAYLNGKTPSLIMVRGYYTYAYVAAYSWDGTNLTQQWLSSNDKNSCMVTYPGGSPKIVYGSTLYGQGTHSLSIADADNDGYDEIIFGSAILDHDGTVLQYNGRGHGDAEHVSDFDNDGQQEIFMVHEAGKATSDVIDFAVDIRRYNDDVMLQGATGDIGRGIMLNVDDEYAAESGNLAAFWSTANGTSLFSQGGDTIGNIPYSNSYYENFAVYWDGDLGRELLDGTKLAKHSIKNNGTTRIYYNRQNSTLPGVSDINGTKANPGLSADILGDWREEIVYPLGGGNGARIYFSTIPTSYRLTTLMHDSQYRCAVAWQNVAYNQPPHQSYYIGSAALAKDSGGNTLNYLAPAVSFTQVEYPDAGSTTPRPTAEPTVEPLTEDVILTADADTYLVDNTAAYGSDTELKINQAESCYTSSIPGLKNIKGLGFMRFNTSSYSVSNLVSATLHLYGKYTNTENKTSLLHLDYCSQDDWDEATFTTDDIVIRGTDTPLSSLGLEQTPPYSTSYKEITFDVTDVIKNSSDKLHTFALWTGTAREQLIASKEYTGTDAKAPTLVLTLERSAEPTAEPTPDPTAEPSPTAEPTPDPTAEPSPTPDPTATPTASPTAEPTLSPTALPTAAPTAEPTASPSPTAKPTETPDITPMPTPPDTPSPTPTVCESITYDKDTKTAVITSLINKTGAVIFASYDTDGKLVSVSVRENTAISTGRNEVTADENFKNTENIKVYIWNSLNEMKPIQ